MSLTSSDSHSGLMPPSVSVVVLPALTVSNLCLVFSSEGVRFFGMRVLNKVSVGPNAKENRVFLTKEVHQPYISKGILTFSYPFSNDNELEIVESRLSALQENLRRYFFVAPCHRTLDWTEQMHCSVVCLPRLVYSVFE